MLAFGATLRCDRMGNRTIHQFISPRAVFSVVERGLVLAGDAVGHHLYFVPQGDRFRAAGKHLVIIWTVIRRQIIYTPLFQNNLT